MVPATEGENASAAQPDVNAQITRGCGRKQPHYGDPQL
ncbi:hypothetical protein EC2853500_0967 [Escherichia coli 2853500]|nr:hypothetical protein EC2853500_0967 [Escherichia coli 2853500]